MEEKKGGEDSPTLTVVHCRGGEPSERDVCDVRSRSRRKWRRLYDDRGTYIQKEDMRGGCQIHCRSRSGRARETVARRIARDSIRRRRS
jgi:hypothetical protein